MSREIKFRAWDIGNLNMMYPNGGYFTRESGTRFLIDANGGVTPAYLEESIVRLPILMQYTGLTDANGIDIYEGDIVEFDRDEWGGDDNIHIVTWNDSEGCWDWGGGCTGDMEWRTVIGNVYENPELLEVEHG